MIVSIIFSFVHGASQSSRLLLIAKTCEQEYGHWTPPISYCLGDIEDFNLEHQNRSLNNEKKEVGQF